MKFLQDGSLYIRLLAGGVSNRGRREHIHVGLTPASMLAAPLLETPPTKIQSCR